MSPRKRKPVVDAQEMLQRALAAESELVEQSRKLEEADRQTNQWKAIVAAMVRSIGGEHFIFPAFVLDEMLNGPPLQAVVEISEDRVIVSVGIEPPPPTPTCRPYWTVPPPDEAALLTQDFEAIAKDAVVDEVVEITGLKPTINGFLRQ